MRNVAEERGGKTSGMLTQEKGKGGKKTSGEDLKERCHAEFTKGEQARNRERSV
jgi:hypothetical protein